MKTENKNYWMHRITHEREVKEALLSDEGLLLTGWGTMSNDSFLEKVFGKGKQDFDAVYSLATGGPDPYSGWKRTLPHNRFFLYMFLNEFKAGDYVIVPGPKDFSVYEIVSDKPFSKEHIMEAISNPDKQNIIKEGEKYYRKDTRAELELGFFWRVKPVELNISRELFAKDALRRRLKFQGTDNNITPLGQDVEDAIKRYRDNAPYQLKDEIVNGAWHIILEKVQSIASDSVFEKTVKYYLERLGATSVEIPAKTELSKEQGDADVVAIFEALQVKIIVQVKHYLKKVDVEAVKQILDAKSVYEDSLYTVIPWVVAACDTFTDEAQMLAEENGVRLITGSEFARLLLDVGFGSFDL